MPDIHTIARRAVCDALTLRGPTTDGGRMVAADPRLFMGDERLALARKALPFLPPGATMADADRLADDIVARLGQFLGETP